MEDRLNVVLYEPSGRGGICHYTYQLAEALAELGMAVTLFTTDNYELKHFRRRFQIYYYIKSSFIKRLFVSLKSCLLGEKTIQGESIKDLTDIYSKGRRFKTVMEVI